MQFFSDYIFCMGTLGFLYIQLTLWHVREFCFKNFKNINENQCISSLVNPAWINYHPYCDT